MTHDRNLEWTARLDRRLIGTRGGKRHILVKVAAPAREIDLAARPPLNLALVIDASGSMGGEPLAAACAAAEGVIDQLGPRDRLTLVSFADDVIVHTDAVVMDAAGRTSAGNAVAGIGTRGCTNLGAGWLEACEHVAIAMEQPAPGGTDATASNRVVVLSDGHANRGLVDPEELALRAAGLCKRGLYTSAIGIGDHYSPLQLEAIAEHGGGRLHDAPLGEDIIAVVLGELAEILGAAADDVTLTVSHPRTATVTALGRYPAREGDGRLRVELGPLTNGAEREVVLQVTVPRGRVGDEFHFGLEPAWRDPNTGEERTAPPLEVALSLVPGVEVSAEPVDLPTARRIAELWQKHVLLESTLLNSEGRYDDARRLVKEVLDDFREYCRGVPDTEQLVRNLDSHGREVSRIMCDESVLAHVSDCKMMMKGQRDYRRNRRQRPRA